MVRLFAIGDLHLPGGPRAKTMDRFGEVWSDHPRRIAAHWSALHQDGDLLLLLGDLSWAMNLDEARDDLAFIQALPGRKVVIKGNHDYWWSGIGKVRKACGPAVHVLQFSHVVIDGVAIVGTRGWRTPGGDAPDPLAAGQGGEPPFSAEDQKIYEREVERLGLALAGLCASGATYDQLVVCLHYPPMNSRHEPSGFTELLDRYGAALCVHGHLHGEAALATAFEGRRGGTIYHCVSADAVRMRPRLVFDGAPLPPPGPSGAWAAC